MLSSRWREGSPTVRELVLNRQPAELYLDLMKNALAFALWPEPPHPIEPGPYRGPLPKRLARSLAFRFIAHESIVLCAQDTVAPDQTEEGRFWPAYADTMIGLKRLSNLQYCIETVLKENIDGDLIETGVWRGGACIFMRAVLAAHGIGDRKVYVADSFEGLPAPDVTNCPADEGMPLHTLGFLAVSQPEVANNFRRYGLLDDQVVFLKGWFKDTLPSAPMEKIGVMRLDGDMYGSTMDALTHLYPRLSRGGFCIVDDYGAMCACKLAVDDFREKNGIRAEIQIIDWTGIYWRKP
jgi:O-methyltransferase